MKTFTKIVAICSLSLLFCCQRKVETQPDKPRLVALFQKIAANPERTYNEKQLDSVAKKLRFSGNSDSGRESMLQLASTYNVIGKSNKYLQTLRHLAIWNQQAKDSVKLAEVWYWIGYYYEDQNAPDSAFSNYLKAEKLYRSIADTLNYGRIKSYKASILYDTGNFTEALSQNIAALRLVEKTKDIRLIYECNIAVALCLKELNENQNALNYFDKALRNLDAIKNEPVEQINKSKASTFNNIGTIYERLKQYAKAIEYYETALKIQNLRSDKPKLYAMLLSNLAYSKMKMGQESDVFALLTESKRIRDSIGWMPGIISSQLKIGQYHLLHRDTVKALASFRGAYTNAQSAKAGAELLQSLQLLTENDRKQNDFYSRIYIKVSDSLQRVERATQNRFARIAYETDEVEAKNKVLSKRNQNILIIAGILLVLGLSAFLLYRLKAKNKELQYQKEQQQANEKIYEMMLQQTAQTQAARNEERNRIAMELHDGIVNSIFTTRFNLMQLDTESADKKEQLVAELKKTEQEVRKVSHELQQNLFTNDQSLPEIVGQLVRAQQNESNTAFDFSNDKYIDWSLVATANKIHLYRIVQEALQNVNKYAQAERCLVMFFKMPDGIALRIWDNGVGFQPDKSREGIGLKNIRSRAEAMHGKLNVTSEPGKGSTIEVVF